MGVPFRSKSAWMAGWQRLPAGTVQRWSKRMPVSARAGLHRRIAEQTFKRLGLE